MCHGSLDDVYEGIVRFLTIASDFPSNFRFLLGSIHQYFSPHPTLLMQFKIDTILAIFA